MKRIFLFLIVSLFLTTAAHAQSFVKDESNTLTTDELKNLSDYVSSVTSESDIRLGLLIKNSLETEPKAVATGTINVWEMGSRSAILLVSFHPRKLYIQPGSDFSGALDLPTCQSICQNIIAPKMRTGSIHQAVLAGLVSMHDTIKLRSNVAPIRATTTVPNDGYSTGTIILIILGILVAFFILVLILSWLSGPRYYSSSGDGFWSGYFFGSLFSGGGHSSSWSDSSSHSSGGGSDWGGFSSDGGGGGGSSW